jgi:hyperosmotically inducible periplasmic protein
MKIFYSPSVKPFLLAFSIFTLVACNNRGDEEIRNDVREQIGSSRNTSGSNAYANVEATVNKGVVTLTGQCEGENCADSLVNRVKEIDGVKDVESNLQETATPTDFTLRTSVQTIISKYQGVQADVAGGVVVLRGSILREQLQPLMNELSTLQAKQIDNQLAVQ